MATLLQLIASLTQWLMLALGGINATRLSTPDTQASPGDYAAYVGGPLAASAVSWIVRRVSRAAKTPDPAPAAVTPSPLGEFLREVFTATPPIPASQAPPLAPGATPLAPVAPPLAPPPAPPADWLHADAGRIVARLTQEGRIEDAERFLGLLKETGHE